MPPSSVRQPTVLTCRLINTFSTAGLLEKHNYGKVMSILRRTKKVKSADGEWRLIRMNPGHMKLLEALKLVPPSGVAAPCGVGRPRKV